VTTDRVAPGQIWRARNDKPRFTVSCPRLLTTGERMVVHRPTDGGAADHVVETENDFLKKHLTRMR
jgi:hypothetical protein